MNEIGNNGCYDDENECYDECEEQRHVHEFLGSVKLAEECEDRHNHRFAGVSGEAMGPEYKHVHKIKTRTDFFEDHFHYINDVSGPPIDVGHGKHVHLVKGFTSVNDGIGTHISLQH